MKYSSVMLLVQIYLGPPYFDTKIMINTIMITVITMPVKLCMSQLLIIF